MYALANIVVYFAAKAELVPDATPVTLSVPLSIQRFSSCDPIIQPLGGLLTHKTSRHSTYETLPLSLSSNKTFALFDLSCYADSLTLQLPAFTGLAEVDANTETSSRDQRSCTEAIQRLAGSGGAGICRDFYPLGTYSGEGLKFTLWRPARHVRRSTWILFMLGDLRPTLYLACLSTSRKNDLARAWPINSNRLTQHSPELCASLELSPVETTRVLLLLIYPRLSPLLRVILRERANRGRT